MEANEERPFPHTGAFHKLAIVHAVCGTLSITIAAVAAFTISHSNQLDSFGLTYVASGTWCGFVFLLTSAAVYLMTLKRTDNYVFAAWLSTAISIVFACTMMSLELATALALASQNYQTALVVFHSVLATIGTCEILVSVLTWTYCCRTHCCDVSVLLPRVKFIAGSDAVPFARSPYAAQNT